MNVLILISALGLVVWSILYVRRNNKKILSPFGLAAMFARGLKKGQFEPALPLHYPEEVRNLMKSLNDLADHLKEQTTRMRALETLRIEFVANVSHELRTPLTSITGYAETLKAGAIEDPKASVEFLGRIEENAERLSQLISDLLDLSKLEGGQQELEWEVFSSDRLIEKL